MSSSPYVRRALQTVQGAVSALLAVRVPFVRLALIAVWALTLWWGEKTNFRSKISTCHWDGWEDWPSDATPHRLVLLADPQLVDPHTYPGRPWPLDRATVLHTDQFLRRSYFSLQHILDPDSIVFLGDLFDGGREWGTIVSDNPDPQWKGYGEKFWLKEYDRWGDIFLKGNGFVGRSSAHPRGDRKIIASLPGNHDLGISSGVRIDVRDRFSMFFGEGNRVDIIGNHSFVSVDTVSLTAKALPSSQEREDTKVIWGPPSDFIDNVHKKKAQALQRYLNGKTGGPENPRLEHSVYKTSDQGAQNLGSHSGPGLASEVPTVLLTHVPLFRTAGTPCGPLREKYPPSKDISSTDGPVTDERNALSLHAGYQYQNVLDPDVSKELIEKIGNVAHVFSGDDHDYCEVVHRGYTSSGGGVREITVKSMSWAMGVRKPGFLLVSLWNPIDDEGVSLPSRAGSGGVTVQTKLCLLPDALGTFIIYGQLLVLTAIVLVVHAFYTSKSSSTKRDPEGPILPLNKFDDRRGPGRRDRADSTSCLASSNSSDSSANGLAVRLNAQRVRSSSPAGGWAIPVAKVEPDPMYSPIKNTYSSRDVPYPKNSSRLWLTALEFRTGFVQVGIGGLLCYTWFIYTF